MPLSHTMPGVLQLWAQDVEQCSSGTDLSLQVIRGMEDLVLLGPAAQCRLRSVSHSNGLQPRHVGTAGLWTGSCSTAVCTHTLTKHPPCRGAVPLQQLLARPRCHSTHLQVWG